LVDGLGGLTRDRRAEVVGRVDVVPAWSDILTSIQARPSASGKSRRLMRSSSWSVIRTLRKFAIAAASRSCGTRVDVKPHGG